MTSIIQIVLTILNSCLLFAQKLAVVYSNLVTHTPLNPTHDNVLKIFRYFFASIIRTSEAKKLTLKGKGKGNEKGEKKGRADHNKTVLKKSKG